MDTITVISTASNRHVVDSYHEAIQSLKSGNVVFRHIGLASDLWYLGDAHGAYCDYGYEVYDFPRPSGSTTPWWHTANIEQEVIESLGSIKDFVNHLIRSYAPNAFLIADDRGPMEVFLIKIFNDKHIPVVLLEHGYGFSFPQEATFTFQQRIGKIMENMYGSLKKRGKSLLKALNHKEAFTLQSMFSSSTMLPEVKPFGHNGDYLICSLCELSKRILIKHGVDAERIRDTGYPYFDKLVRIKQLKESQARAHTQRPRILIVSSGFGIFGEIKRAEKFYSFLIDVIELLHYDYEISVRLKPGEDVSLFLGPVLLRKLQASTIRYDDNAKPSYESLQDYDLVMGDVSMVLLEAIILDKPIVVFHYRDSLKQPKSIQESILRDTLGVIVLDDPLEARKIVKKALASQYITTLTNNLKRNERCLFHRLDGKAGYRVGHVILEAVAGQ